MWGSDQLVRGSAKEIHVIKKRNPLKYVRSLFYLLDYILSQQSVEHLFLPTIKWGDVERVRTLY